MSSMGVCRFWLFSVIVLVCEMLKKRKECERRDNVLLMVFIH